MDRSRLTGWRRSQRTRGEWDAQAGNVIARKGKNKKEMDKGNINSFTTESNSGLEPKPLK
jgi:hypothetical protein